MPDPEIAVVTLTIAMRGGGGYAEAGVRVDDLALPLKDIAERYLMPLFAAARYAAEEKAGNASAAYR